MHEDKYENLSVTSGSSGRVIEAFTMLQENPEAQVIKLQLCIASIETKFPSCHVFLTEVSITSCLSISIRR
jgi:hypothetical protein